MNSPPTLKDIEDALGGLRQPMERKLAEIQDLRDRYVEMHRKAAAVVDPDYVDKSSRLRRSVREQQRRMDRWPQSAVRTLVVCDPDTERIQALALMPEESEMSSIRVGGWRVACIACSFHLLRCQVGDVTPQGLVVSVNGSPLMEPADRRRALDALRAPPLPRHEQKRREQIGRKLRLERFLFERRIREQVWQEQLFQRRRAVEEREQILQEKLRREQVEKEEAKRRALDEWDRERNLLLLGRVAAEEPLQESGLEAPLASPSEPELVPVPDPELVEEIEAIRTSIERMPAPSDLGLVLLGFGCGCLAGLFVAPTAFSLFGAGGAGLAALWVRLSRRKSRQD